MDQVNLTPGTSGPWAVEQFDVIENDAQRIRYAMAGRPIPAGKYTRLVHKQRGVVMSDTPAEMRDHLTFVRAAQGHCLIHGLGLGMCLKAALGKPDVTRVTVVEIDPAVIGLVGSQYEDDRLEVIEADALEYHPQKGVRFGAVWHDIWDSICADNLPDMHKLHRRYGRLSDWQGSWCRPECERARDEAQRWRW